MRVLIKTVQGKKNHDFVFIGKITEGDIWRINGLPTIINVKDHKEGYQYLEIKLEKNEAKVIRRLIE